MRNYIKTGVLLLLIPAFLFLIFGLFLGKYGIYFALFISTLINIFVIYYSDRILLMLHKAKGPNNDGQIYEILKKLSIKANIVCPKLYFYESISPNAFVVGRNSRNAKIVLSYSLINLLTEEEIEAVFAYEISHVVNKDSLLSSSVAVIVFGIMNIFSFLGLLFRKFFKVSSSKQNIFTTSTFVVLAPISSIIVQTFISKSREYLADLGSKKLLGTGVPLANALRSIERATNSVKNIDTKVEAAHLLIFNPISSKELLHLFNTHPSTNDRINKLLYG